MSCRRIMQRPPAGGGQYAAGSMQHGKDARAAAPCYLLRTPCYLCRCSFDILDAAFQVERGLWLVVVLALKDFFERSDGFLQADVLTRVAGKLLGHKERLAQKALDAPGACHRHLILFG